MDAMNRDQRPDALAADVHSRNGRTHGLRLLPAHCGNPAASADHADPAGRGIARRPARTFRRPQPDAFRRTSVAQRSAADSGTVQTSPPQPAGVPVTRTQRHADPAEPAVTGLPRHRAIVALDIEQSTSRPDTVKAELRRTMYDLFDRALRSAGISRRYRDRFTDRGDGVLALIRPVDQVPKAVLLNQAIPALSQLLADYNATIPQASRPHWQLRVRAVVQSGEVHYDANGCFGEALDIAFRLLDAPSVKKTLQAAHEPLSLVISGEIYRTIVRHGYDGIDQDGFRPLARVHVAGNRYTGWIHTPSNPPRPQLAEIISHRSRPDAIGNRATEAESARSASQTRTRRPQQSLSTDERAVGYIESIFGGTTEIQKEIIGRSLGL